MTGLAYGATAVVTYQPPAAAEDAPAEKVETHPGIRWRHGWLIVDVTDGSYEIVHDPWVHNVVVDASGPGPLDLRPPAPPKIEVRRYSHGHGFGWEARATADGYDVAWKWAWTEAGAERKARRTLDRWLARRRRASETYREIPLDPDPEAPMVGGRFTRG